MSPELYVETSCKSPSLKSLWRHSKSGPHVKRLEYHYQVSPEDGGTRLDTEVDFELADLMGMAKPIIQKLTDRELDHSQRTLKDILEMPEAHKAANLLPKHAHHK